EVLVASAWPGNVRQLRNLAERLVVRAHERIVTAADLPRDVLSSGPHVAAPLIARPVPELLFDRMVRDGETFWIAVYNPFMARDLTRNELGALVAHGLTLTRGSYKGLAQLFNVPSDYKRLLNFLRKYQCHLPIHEFRATGPS